MPDLRDDLPTFSSFMMAGFECTAALAAGRRRLDLLGATRHDVLVEEDYQLLLEQEIRTVREGLAWSGIDEGYGVYNFSRYQPMWQAARELGIEQIWDLNHFEYPSWLNPWSDDFVASFAAYARAAVRELRKYFTGQLYIVPVNEISFFAWIGADRGAWAPYTRGRMKGGLFKQQLVKAALAAMTAIWEVDTSVRFIHVDPFMRRVAVPPATPTAVRQVHEFNTTIRFEAWDMLAGQLFPELGGDPRYLDCIGLNYYIHNQEWVFSEKGSRTIRHQLMDWDSPDRVSFAEMIQEVFDRYARPIVITETGSFGAQRPAWWRRVLHEIQAARRAAVPVAGVCAYPALDRPESAGFLLPESGLWDFHVDDETCRRLPHSETLAVIREAATSLR